jgi:hypothetical protein
LFFEQPSKNQSRNKEGKIRNVQLRAKQIEIMRKEYT